MGQLWHLLSQLWPALLGQARLRAGFAGLRSCSGAAQLPQEPPALGGSSVAPFCAQAAQTCHGPAQLLPGQAEQATGSYLNLDRAWS